MARTATRARDPITAKPGRDLHDDVHCPESDGKLMAETEALRLREELARLRGEVAQ